MMLDSDVSFLQKPFAIEKLAEKIQQVLISSNRKQLWNELHSQMQLTQQQT